MSNFIKSCHAVIVLLAIITEAYAASGQAFESGFCVPNGQSVTLDNAVVIVSNQKINDYPLAKTEKHRFFDFARGSQELRFSDNGGSLSLVKSSQESMQKRKIAFFTEITNQGLHESILVECHGTIIKDEFDVCPSDPKLCAYYYCRHRWPPAGCL